MRFLGTKTHLARYGRYACIVRLVVWGRWDGLAGIWQPDDTAGESGFAAFASRQHLAHYLLRRIEGEGKAGLFPAEVLAGLREVVERVRAKTGPIPAALAEVTQAFAAAKVDCLMLKGAPFAMRYFGDPHLRQVHDIDLLVHRADVDRALRLLLGLGYRPKARRLRDAAEGPAIRSHPLRTEHALSLRRGGVTVDLHWRCAPPRPTGSRRTTSGAARSRWPSTASAAARRPTSTRWCSCSSRSRTTSGGARAG